MGWTTEDLWLDSCQGQEIFLFPKMSRPAPGPTQFRTRYLVLSKK
jgi:hypothetical protein